MFDYHRLLAEVVICLDVIGGYVVEVFYIKRTCWRKIETFGFIFPFIRIKFYCSFTLRLFFISFLSINLPRSYFHCHFKFIRTLHSTQCSLKFTCSNYLIIVTLNTTQIFYKLFPILPSGFFIPPLTQNYLVVCCATVKYKNSTLLFPKSTCFVEIK